MNRNQLAQALEDCAWCGRTAYLPFTFPLKNQEVMLISANPSLQAVYKPLPSVRFFRRVCFALFGDKYLREETKCEKYLLEFCDGGIYWTHYRKCYDPSLKDYSLIDDTCAKRYLAHEVPALKNLKLIIVLGDEIAEKVKAQTGALARARNIETIYKPFPNPRNAALFEEVREKLGPYLKHVRSGFTHRSAVDKYVDESGETRGHQAHLRFELGALEKVLDGTPVDVSDNRVESLWYKNLVVPNMRRCSMLVSVYSFVENQIKTLLYECDTEHGRKLISMGRSSRSLSKKCWADALLDYVRMTNPTTAMLQEAQCIRDQIRMLTLLRNAVVHGGGFVSKEVLLHGKYAGNTRFKTDLLPGVFLLAGTVFISKEGEATLANLARRTTELLCKICEREGR